MKARNIFGIRVASLKMFNSYNLWLCKFHSQGNVASLCWHTMQWELIWEIFLVKNKDTILQHWSRAWIWCLHATDYCIRMHGDCFFLDRWIIANSSSWIFQNSSFLDSRSSTLASQLSILTSRNSHVSTFTTQESSFKDEVDTVNLLYLWAVLYFFHQGCKKTAMNSVIASCFELAAYVVGLFDFLFSLVYFSRLKYILAHQILNFSPQNAPRCMTKYNDNRWQLIGYKFEYLTGSVEIIL